MPTIEVLPQSTKHTSAPGWAYVLDTGPISDPSHQPILPSNPSSRLAGAGTTAGGASSHHVTATKRAAARTATDILTGTHTKTQAAKIRTRLEELARDNAGRHDVPVPESVRRELAEARWKRVDKGAGAKVHVADRRQTANVKKVLASEKTWQHHAADLLAAQAALGADGGDGTAAERAAKRRKASGLNAKGKKDKGQGEDDDEEMEDVDEDEPSPEAALVQTVVPSMPSQDVIDALLKAPPLSYDAAAARDSKRTVPPRRFCDMCGYWGRVKCTVCGGFVCGLACKASHDLAEHPHR